MDQTQAQKFNEEETAIYQEQMAALTFQGREKGGTRHNMNKSAAGVHDHIVAHSCLYPFYVLYFSKYTTLIHSTCPSIVIVYRGTSFPGSARAARVKIQTSIFFKMKP